MSVVKLDSPGGSAGRTEIAATAAAPAAMASESLFVEGGPIGFLLVHSLGGSPAELRHVAVALERAGHTVSCPLLAGHGGTRKQLAETSWSDWYAGLEEAHDQLKARCQFIIVGGLSAGGVMTLRLATQRPADVHAITLFSPTLWPDGWAIPWRMRLMKLIIHKWVANLFFLKEREPYGIKDERMRRFLVGALQRQPGGMDRLSGYYGGTIQEFRWMVEAVKSGLSAIKQPTLLIHPREDDRSSLSNSMEIARRLSGIVDVVVLNDCYHVCTLDQQRDLVVERTLAFTDRVAAGVRTSAEDIAARRARTAAE
jgi:carboxylesterase